MTLAYGAPVKMCSVLGFFEVGEEWDSKWNIKTAHFMAGQERIPELWEVITKHMHATDQEFSSCFSNSLCSYFLTLMFCFHKEVQTGSVEATNQLIG